MRSIACRLARLEKLQTDQAPPRRLVVHYGNLKTLPPDYIGPRHVVTVRQIPPEELPPGSRRDPWFEWEERSGPGPDEVEPGNHNESAVRVQYVEGRALSMLDESY